MKTIFFAIILGFSLAGCSIPNANPEAAAEVPNVSDPSQTAASGTGSGGAEIILPGGGAVTPVAPDPAMGGGTGGGTAQAAKNMARNAADKASGLAAPVVPEETN